MVGSALFGLVVVEAERVIPGQEQLLDQLDLRLGLDQFLLVIGALSRPRTNRRKATSEVTRIQIAKNCRVFLARVISMIQRVHVGRSR